MYRKYLTETRSDFTFTRRKCETYAKNCKRNHGANVRGEEFARITFTALDTVQWKHLQTAIVFRRKKGMEAQLLLLASVLYLCCLRWRNKRMNPLQSYTHIKTSLRLRPIKLNFTPKPNISIFFPQCVSFTSTREQGIDWVSPPLAKPKVKSVIYELQIISEMIKPACGSVYL